MNQLARDEKQIGSIIRRRRKQLKLSQSQLGERSGVAFTVILYPRSLTSSINELKEITAVRFPVGRLLTFTLEWISISLSFEVNGKVCSGFEMPIGVIF